LKAEITSMHKMEKEKSLLSIQDHFSITINFLVAVAVLALAMSIGVMLYSALQFLDW